MGTGPHGFRGKYEGSQDIYGWLWIRNITSRSLYLSYHENHLPKFFSYLNPN